MIIDEALDGGAGLPSLRHRLSAFAAANGIPL